MVYLDNANKAAAIATKEVAILNSLHVMTDRAEASRGLRDAAAALRRSLDAANYHVPEGFEWAHENSITLMSQLAQQCDDLADALDRNDQDQIGAIYLAIQTTAIRSRENKQKFQAQITQDSAFIRDTKKLPSLLDDLLRN